jgi:branched-subunit amino acid aminotransferase/4-amino-4-deoxychorismate lyase
LLDNRDCVLETAIANFLAVFDGVVVSPPRNHVLDGISLRVTQELCASAGVGWAERPIGVGELSTATEAMLTGTGFGIAGVRSVDMVALPWPGPVFTKLLAAWSGLVGAPLDSPFS